MKYGLTLLFAALLLTSPCHGEDFDVDDADSLDFEGFHQDSAPAQTAAKSAKPPASALIEPTVASSTIKTAKAISGSMKPPQRFTLSEYYQVTGAKPKIVDAITRLHRQTALRCPAGWEKISEHSTAGDQGYYLVFQLSCL